MYSGICGLLYRVPYVYCYLKKKWTNFVYPPIDVKYECEGEHMELDGIHLADGEISPIDLSDPYENSLAVMNYNGIVRHQVCPDLCKYLVKKFAGVALSKDTPRLLLSECFYCAKSGTAFGELPIFVLQCSALFSYQQIAIMRANSNAVSGMAKGETASLAFGLL